MTFAYPSCVRAALVVLALLCLAPASGAQDQGALFYSGEFNGFAAAPMTYTGPGPDNWVITLTAPASDAASQFLFRDSDVNFDNKWARADGVTPEALTDWFYAAGADGTVPVTGGLSYTFIAQDVADGANSTGIVFETSGALAQIVSVAQSPAAPQGSQAALITASLDVAVPMGQGVYLRYTTDAFASSTVVEMNCLAATSCIASIPASGAGTDVAYYVFSSADGLTLSGAQADRFTANLNNNGGPNYSYTVAASSASVTGAAGWRMLGAPEAGFTVGDLQSFSRVQGVAESFPAENDNVFTYNGTSYDGAASTSDGLASGQGFFWFLENGTNGYTALPFSLTSSGTAPSTDVTVSLNGSTDVLVGNPFQGDINVGAITASGGTLQNDVSIWDPNAAGMTANGNTGSYVTRSRAGSETVSVWQGFWAQSFDGATSLTIPTTAVTSGATFVGKSAAGSVARLRFRLTGEGVADFATSLVVSPEATEEYDTYDLIKLTPLAASYAALAFEGLADGEMRLKATESLPSHTEKAHALPLALDVVGFSGDLTLTWEPAEADLPEGWAYLLTDLQTGETVDLLTADRYTFSVAATKAARSNAEIASQSATLTDASIRFTLTVGPASAVAAEGSAAPEADALTGIFPNPTAGAVRIEMDLASGGDATLVVFDLLGREVAREALGVRSAGRQTVTMETAAWAAGTYLVRMDVDGESRATRRLVRVR